MEDNRKTTGRQLGDKWKIVRDSGRLWEIVGDKWKTSGETGRQLGHKWKTSGTPHLGDNWELRETTGRPRKDKVSRFKGPWWTGDRPVFQ